MNKHFYYQQFIVLIFLSIITTVILKAGDVYDADTRRALYQEVECTFERINRTDIVRSHPFLPGPVKSICRSPRTKIQSSANWAGYIGVSNITRPAHKSVSKVSGTWIAPTIVPSLIDASSALWIGFDGYSNGSVEQIGTDHTCTHGIIHHYAWFEMFPGPSYKINGFPLQSGDSISATITYSHSGIFTMILFNDTEHTFVTIPTHYTTSTTAERSSAEWILEAPLLNNVILPLANFVTAQFKNCNATINGISTVLGAMPTIEVVMLSPTGSLKADASTIESDKTSFTVTWAHE